MSSLLLSPSYNEVTSHLEAVAPGSVLTGEGTNGQGIGDIRLNMDAITEWFPGPVRYAGPHIVFRPGYEALMELNPSMVPGGDYTGWLGSADPGSKPRDPSTVFITLPHDAQSTADFMFDIPPPVGYFIQVVGLNKGADDVSGVALPSPPNSWTEEDVDQLRTSHRVYQWWSKRAADYGRPNDAQYTQAQYLDADKRKNLTVLLGIGIASLTLFLSSRPRKKG